MSGRRLVLRPPAVSDVDALVRLRGDPDVRRYLGGPVARKEALDKAYEVIGSDTHFVVEDTSGEVAGLVSLTSRRADLELSYEFFPGYWGQGLARHACEDLLTRVAVPRPSRLVAVTQRSNERSRRLLHSLGFSPEEEFEEFGAAQVLYVHRG